MRPSNRKMREVPWDIVGSTTFGRYPIISTSQTWNMIISDGFLVPFAGYKVAAQQLKPSQGRGIFNSVRGNFLLVVVGNSVYKYDNNLNRTFISAIATQGGTVYIDENQKTEIAICDGVNIYIYNYTANTFLTATLDFQPGYVTFQDGRFIAPDIKKAQWRLSDTTNSTLWPADSAHVGVFQTKGDIPVAITRFPGRGNLIMIMGSLVTEFWYDVGAPIFPYQKNTSQNVDYGCLSAATIAYNENTVIWLGTNDKSGPVIVYTDGGDIKSISTDGINFLFSQLTNPSDAYGFLFKQDGHLIYQLTFVTDNLSLIYDFNTGKFFNVSDQNSNYHIAKRVAYFNGVYYFVSFNDGNLYSFESTITTLNGNECPRTRISSNIRLPDKSRFIVNNGSFNLEMGTSFQDFQMDLLPRVDLSCSYDSGQTFGNTTTFNCNPLGNYQNQIIFWQLGIANDFVAQLRFWGFGRFVAGDGVFNIYQ